VTLEEAIASELSCNIPDCAACVVQAERIKKRIRQWLTDQGGDMLQPTDDGWRAVKVEPYGGYRLYTITPCEEPTDGA
jgi:hypothetical protein